MTLDKSVLDIRFHLKTDFRDNAQDNEIPCWLAEGERAPVGVAIFFDPAEQAAASSENVRLFLLLVVSAPSLSLRTCLQASTN